MKKKVSAKSVVVGCVEEGTTDPLKISKVLKRKFPEKTKETYWNTAKWYVSALNTGRITA